MRWGLGAVWLRLRWQRKGSQTLFCQEVRKTVFPFSLPSPKDHKITAEKEHCPEFSFLGRLIAFVWGQEPPVKYAGCEVMAHDGDGLQDPPYWLLSCWSHFPTLQWICWDPTPQRLCTEMIILQALLPGSQC